MAPRIIPKKKILLMVACVGVVGILSVRGEKYHLWRDVKEGVGFGEYAPEQRVKVAEQAKALFEIYVNRDAKIERYGPSIDPLSQITEMVSKAASLSDRDFHHRMSEIFLSQHDPHTQYEFPAPHRCYSTLSPLSFSLISSPSESSSGSDPTQWQAPTNPQVAVGAITTRPEILGLFTEEEKTMLAKVEVGDVLIKVDGVTFAEFVRREKGCGGSSEWGQLVDCAVMVGRRAGTWRKLHEDGSVEFVLRRGRGRGEYVVKLPIAAKIDERCLKSAKMTLPQPTNPDAPSIIGGNNKWFYDIPKLGYNLQPTDDPSIFYTILQPHNIGILRFETFNPTRLNSDDARNMVRDLLLNELKDTLGLVLDIRGNAGGSLVFAESLLQLFTHQKVKPAQFRTVVSDINKRIFNEGPLYKGGKWQQAINEAGPNDRYAPLVSMSTEISVNGQRQVYLKPVAILTNAECFSACESFAALWQDHGVGKIYGEEPQTGGGGAIVVDANGLGMLLPDVFGKLPGDQNMMVGWRQMVRQGEKSAGRLVEDFGVEADEVLRVETRDLRGEGERGTIARVATKVLEEGARSGRSFASFISEPMERRVEAGSPVEFKGTVSWLTRIELHHENKLLNEITFPAGVQEATEFTLGSQTPFTRLGTEEFIIKGYVGDEQILETKRYARIVPPEEDYLRVEDGMNWQWDFTFNNNKFIGVYNERTNSEDGWRTVPAGTSDSNSDAHLVVGDGIQYKPQVMTQVSLFLHLVPGTDPSLKIKGDYKVFSRKDSFSVMIFGQNMVRTGLGGAGRIDGKIRLEDYAGMRVEVQVKFVSESGGTERGVMISELAVVG
ncbi:hypothetical protein HK102_000626 [Quaeritorhiza haematococci]|nr:hypothetical protein HK102_000626 [Quaeritorhiza haematococci]